MMFRTTILLITAFSALCPAKPVDLAMGARAFGMGGAFAAISDDATAAYWNPAGLAQLEYITFSETNWILAEVEKVNVNYFNTVFPIKGIGTVAGGWLLQHAKLEEGSDATYNETSWNEHSFCLTAGRRLWEKLWIFEGTSLGFSLNRHVISAGGDNGAGVGFDLGFLTSFPYGISLGLVAKSVATDMMGERIKPEYRTGLGYIWHDPRHRVTVAADWLFKADVEYSGGVDGVDDLWGTNNKAFVGVEYRFTHNDWSVGVRGGGNMLLKSERENIVLTSGIGFGFSGIHAEYAYQMNTENDLSIGRTHRLTLECQLERFLKMMNVDIQKSEEVYKLPVWVSGTPESKVEGPDEGKDLPKQADNEDDDKEEDEDK